MVVLSGWKEYFGQNQISVWSILRIARLFFANFAGECGGALSGWKNFISALKRPFLRNGGVNML